MEVTRYGLRTMRYRNGCGSGCSRVGLHHCRDRAVFDALHDSSLGFQRLLGKTVDDMRVDVTTGVPKPEAVDGRAVLETLPHGTGHIKVVHGGLQVLNEKGDDGVLIANAIVLVSLDDGK